MSRLRSKVNADENCDDYESEAAFREALPWDEERVTYISTRWDVSRNCARALILSELEKSTKEIASLLYVTESTVKGYIEELCDKIHVDVVMGISYKRWNGKKYDVWGKGKAEPIPVTESKEQLDPEFRPQETPRNKGIPLSEIPKDLITLDVNVEVDA